MDETIDLRPYVKALTRRWLLILGVVILSTSIAVLYYFLQTDYKATALVAVTEPTRRIQFDTRIINTADLENLLQAFPELAVSDGVVSQLLMRVKEMSGSEISTYESLRDIIDVEIGADARLVRLIVRHEDPQFATSLANIWAEIFVKTVNSLYLDPESETEFFQSQLTQTNTRLTLAEQALVDFQSGNRANIVANELGALNTLQATYLAEQNRLDLIKDDIRSLRNQISAGPSDTILWADQLTALLIQMNIYETRMATDAPPQAPIQLQLNSQGDLTTSRRDEQLRLLEEMNETINTRLGGLGTKMLGLQSQIFVLQREQQELVHTQERLTRDRDILRETYQTLARKIDETRILSEDSDGGVKIASLAERPEKPERTSIITLVLLTAVSSFLIVAGIIIAITWWKQLGEASAA